MHISLENTKETCTVTRQSYNTMTRVFMGICAIVASFACFYFICCRGGFVKMGVVVMG